MFVTLKPTPRPPYYLSPFTSRLPPAPVFKIPLPVAPVPKPSTPEVPSTKRPASAGPVTLRTEFKVAIVGHYRMVDALVKRLGTNLTAWSDVKFVSYMSAKVPKGCRAVVVLVDFRDLGWRLMRMAIDALEYYNPRVPVYLVWSGTPPEGKTAIDRVLELCEGVSINFEILAEGDLLGEIRKLSVQKTRSLTSSA